jgi:hypothetical protein
MLILPITLTYGRLFPSSFFDFFFDGGVNLHSPSSSCNLQLVIDIFSVCSFVVAAPPADEN